MGRLMFSVLWGDPTHRNRALARPSDTQLSLFVWGESFWESLGREPHRVLREATLGTEIMPGLFMPLIGAHNVFVDALKAAEKACLKEAFKRRCQSPDQQERACLYQQYYEAGECWVCGDPVGKRMLDKGHLVDRMLGGSDLPENVMPMCVRCNQFEKDLHRTRKETFAWRAEVRRKAWLPLEEVPTSVSTATIVPAVIS